MRRAVSARLVVRVIASPRIHAAPARFATQVGSARMLAHRPIPAYLLAVRIHPGTSRPIQECGGCGLQAIPRIGARPSRCTFPSLPQGASAERTPADAGYDSTNPLILIHDLRHTAATLLLTEAVRPP